MGKYQSPLIAWEIKLTRSYPNCVELYKRIIGVPPNGKFTFFDVIVARLGYEDENREILNAEGMNNILNACELRLQMILQDISMEDYVTFLRLKNDL